MFSLYSFAYLLVDISLYRGSSKCAVLLVSNLHDENGTEAFAGLPLMAYPHHYILRSDLIHPFLSG